MESRTWVSWSTVEMTLAAAWYWRWKSRRLMDSSSMFTPLRDERCISRLSLTMAFASAVLRALEAAPPTA